MLNSQDITSIVIAVLGIILPPLVGAVVVFAQQQLAKLPANQSSVLVQVAQVVVSGVQQSMKNMTPEQKKAAALGQFTSLMGQLGLKVSPEVASAVIESAVFALNTASSEVAKDTTLPTVALTSGAVASPEILPHG